MGYKSHWDRVYSVKSDSELSWTQQEPRVSLELIREVLPRGRVIDVGGGGSPLAGRLLDAGYAVAVLDLSATALDRARKTLGSRAAEVRWITGDVTALTDVGAFDLWHDRAAFHFLTVPQDRRRYIALLSRSVPIGGHAVMATFALDGPEKCSGLDVVRYDGPSLGRELGPEFRLLKTVPEIHLTPWGQRQSFQYSVFIREGERNGGGN